MIRPWSALAESRQRARRRRAPGRAERLGAPQPPPGGRVGGRARAGGRGPRWRRAAGQPVGGGAPEVVGLRRVGDGTAQLGDEAGQRQRAGGAGPGGAPGRRPRARGGSARAARRRRRARRPRSRPGAPGAGARRRRRAGAPRRAAPREVSGGTSPSRPIRSAPSSVLRRRRSGQAPSWTWATTTRSHSRPLDRWAVSSRTASPRTPALGERVGRDLLGGQGVEELAEPDVAGLLLGARGRVEERADRRRGRGGRAGRTGRRARSGGAAGSPSRCRPRGSRAPARGCRPRRAARGREPDQRDDPARPAAGLAADAVEEARGRATARRTSSREGVVVGRGCAAPGPGRAGRGRRGRPAARSAAPRPGRRATTSGSSRSSMSRSTTTRSAASSGSTAGSRTSGVSSLDTSTGTPAAPSERRRAGIDVAARPDQDRHVGPAEAVLEVGAAEQVGDVLGLGPGGVEGQHLDAAGAERRARRRRGSRKTGELLERDRPGDRRWRPRSSGRPAAAAGRTAAWCPGRPRAPGSPSRVRERRPGSRGCRARRRRGSRRSTGRGRRRPSGRGRRRPATRSRSTWAGSVSWYSSTNTWREPARVRRRGGRRPAAPARAIRSA